MPGRHAPPAASPAAPAARPGTRRRQAAQNGTAPQNQSPVQTRTLKRDHPVRKAFVSTGAMLVALGLAATMAIPAASASIDPSATTTQLSFASGRGQDLTVSSKARLAAVTRDGSTIVRAMRGAGPGIGSVNGWNAPIASRITSPWGPRQVICTAGVGCDAGFHHGDDFATSCNRPFYAVAAGVVTAVTRGGLAGDEIVIDHGSGISTAYSHMFDSGILVTKGEKISAGQNIGLVGSSGDSTGCHLYFEYRVGGTTVDPVPAMASHGVVLG